MRTLRGDDEATPRTRNELRLAHEARDPFLGDRDAVDFRHALNARRTVACLCLRERALH